MEIAASSESEGNDAPNRADSQPVLQTLIPEIHLNNNYKFSSHLTEDTQHCSVKL
jgi:hypothetical protein